MSEPWWAQWNPDDVMLMAEEPDDAWKTCVLQGVYFGENEYNGMLGARISAIFVVLITSFGATLFPVISERSSMKVPKYVYLFARNFGTGVIVATAFIHLLDPAYSAIGGNSCVGGTGHWADYAWCPAIMLASVFIIFLVDLFASVYTERKFGVKEDFQHDHVGAVIASDSRTETSDIEQRGHVHQHQGFNHEHHIDGELVSAPHAQRSSTKVPDGKLRDNASCSNESIETERDFQSQFGAFLILEFGVIFHSVMIGLTLGSTGEEFKTLYPVIVFHQAFEGLGMGARLSQIPFPHSKRMLPYFCCLAYGLCTPIAIAIGLGVRNSYVGSSYEVNVVSGVLDAISAGILLYTGLVELLARDFIFNPHRTKSMGELLFSVNNLLWGAGLMALLGKWA